MREQGKMLKVIKELYEAEESKEITIICKDRERIETLILQSQQFILKNFEYKEMDTIYKVLSKPNYGFTLEFYSKHGYPIDINFVNLSYNKTEYIIDAFETQDLKDEEYYEKTTFQDRFLECLGADIKDK